MWATLVESLLASDRASLQDEEAALANLAALQTDESVDWRGEFRGAVLDYCDRFEGHLVRLENLRGCTECGAGDPCRYQSGHASALSSSAPTCASNDPHGHRARARILDLRRKALDPRYPTPLLARELCGVLPSLNEAVTEVVFRHQPSAASAHPE